VGRALRVISHILDSQSAPIEHGRHFVSRLGNAVVFFAMRGERQPWGAKDTAFVFQREVTPRSAPASCYLPNARGSALSGRLLMLFHLLFKMHAQTTCNGFSPFSGLFFGPHFLRHRVTVLLHTPVEIMHDF
jgi:hypothetical protein